MAYPELPFLDEIGNSSYIRSVGVVDEKLELLQNIIRLRRVGREVPGNPDVARVRIALEERLGETVSRRLAARALGVSHTALERWIKSGDLPLVHTRSGKLEVPVPALIELYESVERDRQNGVDRYVLNPTMARQRDAARRLRVDEAESPRGRDTHERARDRSRAYHRAVARRLRRPMVDEARHVLFRWREQGRIHTVYANRWEELLSRPLPEIRRSLTETSRDADDLRQNSPFAGLLSEPERQRILREVR